MNNRIDTALVHGIQALTAENDAARRLLETFAGRQKDARETTVDRAAWLAGSDYGSMVKVMKALADLGAGRFIPGRHGYASRMEWGYSIRSLGNVAQGKARKLAEVASDADPEDAGPTASTERRLHEHEFQLRGDLKIKFELPADLTEKEAERLGAYLKTLPF